MYRFWSNNLKTCQGFFLHCPVGQQHLDWCRKWKMNMPAVHCCPRVHTPYTTYSMPMQAWPRAAPLYHRGKQSRANCHRLVAFFQPLNPCATTIWPCPEEKEKKKEEEAKTSNLTESGNIPLCNWRKQS
jgi:hypothetical protein